MTHGVPVAWQTTLLSACLVGCAGGPAPDRPQPYSDATAEHLPADSDLDRDGLCDNTETALGTDPERADTDGDGLPDALEQIAGSDPRDRLDPNRDRVAYLQAGRSLDVDIAVVLDEPAGSIHGELADRNALDAQSRRAGDYHLSTIAVSAQPPENVREIEADKARFVSVLGHTRLAFRLRFEAPSIAAVDCAPVLPFDLLAVDETSVARTSERALLVVTNREISPETDAHAIHYCLPIACL